MALILKNPLAFFDIEATGLNIQTDRIVEIAIVKLFPNGEKKKIHKRINPEIPIPKEASLIHGIYDGDVENCPFFSDIANEILEFFKDSDLSGFNLIKFDIPILIESFLREGINFNIEKKNIIDVQKIFHTMEKRNLSSAYKFYCKKNLENAHSALADTEATLEVLYAQVDKYLGEKVIDINGTEIGFLENNVKKISDLFFSNYVDLAAKMIYNENKEPLFNFGKYKGKKVEEILKKDPYYYDWMIKENFPLETKQKLTQIKLNSKF